MDHAELFILLRHAWDAHTTRGELPKGDVTLERRPHLRIVAEAVGRLASWQGITPLHWRQCPMSAKIDLHQ